MYVAKFFVILYTLLFLWICIFIYIICTWIFKVTPSYFIPDYYQNKLLNHNQYLVSVVRMLVLSSSVKWLLQIFQDMLRLGLTWPLCCRWQTCRPVSLQTRVELQSVHCRRCIFGPHTSSELSSWPSHLWCPGGSSEELHFADVPSLCREQ